MIDDFFEKLIQFWPITMIKRRIIHPDLVDEKWK